MQAKGGAAMASRVLAGTLLLCVAAAASREANGQPRSKQFSSVLAPRYGAGDDAVFLRLEETAWR
jgi:hypothetical protein